ncbi:MAG: fibronectin type III domain-containing protein [Actinomycetota bacterium]|nr:fibronectin type III domain-containing protein [Actinomycetota bacterium]
MNSVGVNVHMYYNNTPYVDLATVKSRLTELGVRHVRDGMVKNRPDFYAALNSLADAGIKSTLIMGAPNAPTGTFDELLPLVKTEVPRAVEAVEGPNEYYFSGPGWQDHLLPYQRDLYNMVKADPALKALPVVGASAFDLDLSAYLDYGNIHPYPNNQVPSSNIDTELAAARKVSGSKPVYATETGYHNALATTDGHRPISEQAAARYIPRLYLDYFRRGIPRTFLYEMVDEFTDSSRTNIQAHFGLLRYDLTRKPAFSAMANFIKLLSDPGAPFAPGSLSYRAMNAPASVRQLLFQKRDGSFYLVLWNDVSVWDSATGRDLQPPDVDIAIELNQPISTARVYRPFQSADPQVVSNSPTVLGLRVPADPIVVQLTPGTAQPPTSGPPRPPTGVTATAVAPDRIDLSWNPSGGATGYQVYHATVGGPGYQPLGTFTSQTSFSHGGLRSGSTHHYLVRAVNGAGESGDSFEAVATTPGPTIPLPPSNVKAVAVAPDRIDVSWTASAGATAYQVYHATVGGPGYQPLGVPTSQTRFSHGGLQPISTHYYLVRAVNGAGESGDSFEAVATTPEPPIPLPPSNVKAVAVAPDRIDVSWTASAGATAYQVYHAKVGGPGYQPLGVPTSQTGFSHGGLQPGSTHYYLVRALNRTGESGDSFEAVATTSPRSSWEPGS